MTNFVEAAHYYRQLGWAVFPLAANAKIPAIAKSKGGQGFKDATRDAKVIDQWAREYPGCNIGIATGSFNLFKAGKIFPPCPEAVTGNGGKHLFYKLPDGLKASKDRLGKGIDVKAEGGYVVGAPSRIGPSEQGPGGEYKWTYVPMRGQELPSLPKWALEALAPKRPSVIEFSPQITAGRAARELEGMAAMLAHKGEGHRNISLNWAAYYAGKLVNDGLLDANRAHSRLISAALTCGLSLPEAEAAFKSGFNSASK
jgi:hypothetical protein